jgi:hypothetical protein
MKRRARNLLFPNANGFRISATSVGHVLSPEHQKIIDRARENLIRQYEGRRKSDP